MTLRPPDRYGARRRPDPASIRSTIEIAAEKAAALGRAGEKVEQTLARLRVHASAARPSGPRC